MNLHRVALLVAPLAALSWAAGACGGRGSTPPRADATGPAPVTRIQPLRATATLAHDPDDPAIWIHPASPERSLILGTVKAAAPDGGLAVFGLDGTLRQFVTGIDRPNNVDVEYGLTIGGRTIDIAVVTERYARRLRVFAIAPEGSGVSDLAQLPVLEGEPGEGGAPMGIGMYRRPRDGAIFAIVAPKTGPRDGYLWQYRLHDGGAGRLVATRVRRFGQFSGAGEIEAIAIDDAAGHIYYADEGNGIHKWHADPEHPDAARPLAHFARDAFGGDREGIAIYAAPDDGGYVIATDQLPLDSQYRVYRRGTSEGGVDAQPAAAGAFSGGADSTDGIEVTARSLGPEFPRGLFVAMNSSARNFLLFRWEDVEQAIASPQGRQAGARPTP